MLNSEENKTPWYDSLEGIEKACESLSGLNDLISERRTAAYVRRERLSTFYVMGFLYLDTCGNCGRLSERDTYNYKDMPRVLRNESFWEELEARGIDQGLAFSMVGATVPPFGIKCAHCQKTWTINNCDDLAYKSGEEYLSGRDFSGLTLGELRDELKLRCGCYLRYHERAE